MWQLALQVQVTMCPSYWPNMAHGGLRGAPPLAGAERPAQRAEPACDSCKSLNARLYQRGCHRWRQQKLLSAATAMTLAMTCLALWHPPQDGLSNTHKLQQHPPPPPTSPLHGLIPEVRLQLQLADSAVRLGYQAPTILRP